MKKSSNTESELKKCVAFKNKRVNRVAVILINFYLKKEENYYSKCFLNNTNTLKKKKSD